MKDQVVSYEIAKLAKEFGFVQKIDTLKSHYYNHDGVLDGDVLDYVKAKIRKKETKFLEPIFAPTQSLVQKWFREKHQIQICAQSITKNKKNKFIDFYWSIRGINIYLNSDPRDKNFDTYEEALEMGIKEAFKLLGEEKKQYSINN